MQNHPKHVVGRSLPRVDIIEKVTGAARYNRDTIPSHTMAVTLVGSPHPHLRIRRIDVTEALQVPGVIRVITAHDLSGPTCLPHSIQPFLAGATTRYKGEPLALVVARNQDAAERATERIHLDYEELPTVLTLQDALQPGVPLVHNTMEGNVWQSYSAEVGDPSQAFSDCDQVFEREFSSQGQTQDWMECPSMTTQVDPQDGFVIQGTTQHPYLLQATVAHLLELPFNRIQVIQHALRGNSQGYALRSALLGSYTALAAWLTGHPVTIHLSRKQAMESFGHRPSAHVKMKMGVTRSGELQACEMSIYLNMGAYAHDVGPLLHRTLSHALGPYKVPHHRVTVHAVATHTPPVSLLPGYGQMATCFARESMLDDIAHRLGLSPAEFRENNLLHPGDKSVWGQEIPDIHGLIDTLKATPIPTDDNAEDPNFDLDDDNIAASQEDVANQVAPYWQGEVRKRRGWGMALTSVGLSSGGEGSPPQAMASVHVQSDGSVLLNVPQVDASSDNQTRLTQMAAEILAAPFESIRFLDIDTTHLPAPTPVSLPTSIVLTGQALQEAALPLRVKMLTRLASHWGCATEDIQSRVGGFTGPEDAQISFMEVAQLCWQQGIPLANYGSYTLPVQVRSADSQKATPESLHYPAYAYGVFVAEVEVDLDTKEVEVLSIHVACDIGKVINPMLARNQLISGAYQGLHYTLLSLPSQEDDSLRNIGHPIRTMGTAPAIHPIVIEHDHAVGALGHKGLDALPSLGIAPAIANAIAQATGERVCHVPILPEMIVGAMPRDAVAVDIDENGSQQGNHT
ncbi:MAG: hypothetical protein EP343_14380 [Deltaproteobacteria bacterium]|nr:MAG: hypothetical protein EP343_14380 [Deltaproteobacteria bacterium]